MYTLFQILVLITSLLHGRTLPNEQSRITATAISEAAHTQQEAAMLITVSFFETGFRSEGHLIPFGLSSNPSLCRTNLTTCAQGALQVLHRGQRVCGNNMSHVFGFYHTGRCITDHYAVMSTRRYQEIYRSLGEIGNEQHSQ